METCLNTIKVHSIYPILDDRVNENTSVRRLRFKDKVYFIVPVRQFVIAMISRGDKYSSASAKKCRIEIDCSEEVV